MYRITIQKLEEYDETITAWRDPENPTKLYYSKYDIAENVKERAVSHERPTGKKLINSTEIFDQTVEEMDLTVVIKAINGIE